MDEEPNWRDSPIANNWGCVILIGMAIALGVEIFVLGCSIMSKDKNEVELEDSIKK